MKKAQKNVNFYPCSKKIEFKCFGFRQNVFEYKNLEANTIIARAFKPIQVIFKIVSEILKNLKI